MSEWVEAKHRCAWCGAKMLVRLADRRQRCPNDCASGLGECPEEFLPDPTPIPCVDERCPFNWVRNADTAQCGVESHAEGAQRTPEEDEDETGEALGFTDVGPEEPAAPGGCPMCDETRPHTHEVGPAVFDDEPAPPTAIEKATLFFAVVRREGLIYGVYTTLAEAEVVVREKSDIAAIWRVLAP